MDDSIHNVVAQNLSRVTSEPDHGYRECEWHACSLEVEMRGGTQLSLATVDAPPPGTDHGEVFTRRWVAELILDLAGYTVDEDLGSKTVVEPSCGTGAFLVPIVERLLESVGPEGIAGCQDQIRAVDLLEANSDRTRKTVIELLANAGTPLAAAEHVAATWVRTGDFLLSDLDVPAPGADFIVGNPPYVRLENVSAATMAAYRQKLTTMTGRSDLYVGFYERGLRLLADGGTLAFICADRWMHNQYGAALREFVSERYSLDTIITMHDVDAFEETVSSYPAISVLRARPQGGVVAATAKADFRAPAAARLQGWIRGQDEIADRAEFTAARLDRWHQGPGLWPSGNPVALALVTELEERFSPLQDEVTGTRVGIGVATGADGVYLTTDFDIVEVDRLLPVVTADDIASGRPVWSGKHLVNPWTDDGLVDLARYPRLAAYFERHRGLLRARHVAQRRPATWYRTIDRVTPGLQQRPKLLLPDIKARSHPVLDNGDYYPHHNLYYVVSEGWDLEALGGLLLSDVANLFVGTYCVKMRGGCYRFQAQYLRQIRVPAPRSLKASTVSSLAAAFRDRDHSHATEIACSLYGIDAQALRRAIR